MVTRPFKGHQSKTVFLKCTQNTTMTAYSFNQNQFVANFNVLSTPLLLRTLQANSTYILSISSLVSITTSTSSPIFFEKHVPLTHGRYCRHGKQRIWHSHEDFSKKQWLYVHLKNETTNLLLLFFVTSISTRQLV